MKDLFSLYPKTDKEGFFDRERELAKLIGALKRGERLIVVKGRRRSGKSSLINVALNELEMPHIFIHGDLLSAEFGEKQISKKAVVSMFLNEIKAIEQRFRNILEELTRYIEQISTPYGGITLREIVPSLREVLERINEACEKKEIRFVIVLDEIQALKNCEVDFGKLINGCIERLGNLTFILTASQAGAISDLMGLSDPKAPLYGRGRVEITLESFSKDMSLQFLKTGLSGAAHQPDTEILEYAYEKLDGIVGWLAQFGHWCLTEWDGRRESAKKRIDLLFNEAVSEEIRHIQEMYRANPDIVTALEELESEGARLYALQTELTLLASYAYVKESPEGVYRYNDSIIRESISRFKNTKTD